MLLIAIILFLIAAGFGFVVLVSILQDKPTPKVFVYTHGSLAVLALLIVGYYIFKHPSQAPLTSFILFLIAALGGIIMFFIDMKGKPVPKWLALIHPLVGLVALLILVIFLLTLPEL